MKRIKQLLKNIRYSEIPDSDFDPVQLKRGAEVELEHTDDLEIAKAIAKAHLKESPNYYIELKKMEKKLNAE